MSSPYTDTLAEHVMAALQEHISAHGADTPEIRAQFFLKLATANLGALATFASDDSVRRAAMMAAEAALEEANAARRERQETLQ